MPWKSVKYQLTLCVFFACMLPYVLSSLYISKIEMEGTKEDYILMSYQCMEKIHLQLEESMIKPACDTASLLALDEDNIDLINKVNAGLIADRQTLDHHAIHNFDILSKTYSEIKRSYIATAQGEFFSYPQLKLTKPARSNVNYLYQLALTNKGKPAMSDPYLTTTGEQVISIVHTIEHNNEVIGFLGLNWNLHELQQAIEDISIGPSSYFIVLNPNNKIVVSPKHSEWLLKTPQELGLTDLTGLENKTNDLYEVNLDQKKQLMHVNISAKTGWKVLSIIDAEVFAAQVRESMYQLTIIFFLTIAFILMAIILATKRITNPIYSLIQNARIMAAGNLDVQVTVYRNDEIGFLATTFNEMASKLKQTFYKIKQQNNELYKKNQEVKTLLENAQDIILRVNTTLTYIYINPIIQVYTGIPAQDFINKNIAEFKADIFSQTIEPFCKQALLSGQDECINFELTSLNGELLYFHAHIIPEFDTDGQIISLLSIIRNITEHIELEKKLMRLDRLNLVGEMAAGIAHEVRNPLTTVRGFLQVLATKSTDNQHYFSLMIDELDRANSIITEYLSLAKNKSVNLHKKNLNDIIKALQPLLQADAFISNITVQLELSKVPELFLDEKQLRQLILNLARNGLEAMPTGGSLTIRTYLENNQLCLAITDEGPGIDAVIMDNLGIPFMTTKDNGTGLGLAVCYSIANRHNAVIDINSSPAGTTVFVRFKLDK